MILSDKVENAITIAANSFAERNHEEAANIRLLQQYNSLIIASQKLINEKLEMELKSLRLIQEQVDKHNAMHQQQEAKQIASDIEKGKKPQFN